MHHGVVRARTEQADLARRAFSGPGFLADAFRRGASPSLVIVDRLAQKM
jgi:hypothetical protein